MRSIVTSFLYIISITLFAVLIHFESVDKHNAQLIRIIDGDTIIVTMPNWPSVVGNNIPIRIDNIDAPERACLDQWNESRDYLVGLMTGVDEVELRDIERGKYFRLIAEVWVGDESVGERMIESGYAVEYGYGQKECNNLN